MSNPIYFPDITGSDGERIAIKDRFEICQGGPNIGRLVIDDQYIFPDQYFGGPMISNAGYLYLPLRKKKWLFNGFVLAKIELATNDIVELNIKSDVINLLKIENGKVYYTEGLESSDLVKTLDSNQL